MYNLTMCCKHMTKTTECGGGYISNQDLIHCCPNNEVVPCPDAICEMHYNGRRIKESLRLLHFPDSGMGYPGYHVPQIEEFPTIQPHPDTTLATRTFLNFNNDIISCGGKN